ncbi:SCO1860 family LAETG-anchored protein [Streptomyces sp. NPDC005573]|uniref:SCO1860 family LAETG-anchored protein n=1 Tax=Streptomyces sp. NPDC005573 TaxID=3156890 RepID=UPI0033B72099
MNSNNFRMPARRPVTLATVAALTAAPLLLGASAAHATGKAAGEPSGEKGRASAVVLRAGLDVSLLDKTVHVPLTASLNEVHAPDSADRTALSARLDGVNGGRPFAMLAADVASAKATATAARAQGSVRLVDARVHMPGLPLLSLVEIGTVTADATCEAGKAPTAAANVLGAVTVLGKRVTLTAGGPTRVRVPGVGEVAVAYAEHRTTSRTAAATALELKVSVDPLKLNVADVEGTLTLARATCESPGHRPAGHPVPSHDPAASPLQEEAGAASPAPTADAAPDATPDAAPDLRPQAANAGLADTGSPSATPYLAGGALALLLVGGGVLTVMRRRRS